VKVFSVYDQKIKELVQPVVVDVCSTNFDLFDGDEKDEIELLTALFELYLLLKGFSDLAATQCNLTKFYEWFARGVTFWFDVSTFKALTRIEKAIELDPLTPVEETVNYSSSAVDTVAIFFQIKVFWQQLAWPDAEGAFVYVEKIIDDICRCCDFYVDQITARVNNLNKFAENKFQVTEEWGLTINNIDYVSKSFKSFIVDFGIDEILQKLPESYAEKLEGKIKTAVDMERSKVFEFIQSMMKKMSPVVASLLIRGAEKYKSKPTSIDKLMLYLDNSLKLLHEELNEKNFQHALSSIWAEISTVFTNLVQESLEKGRPPSFFSSLRVILQIMRESFMSRSDSDMNLIERLNEINKDLLHHGYETSELVHHYYKERYLMQEKMDTAPHGILTIKCFFQENKLVIEILNASNLRAMDSNGLSDPFVVVDFHPEEHFKKVKHPKTKVQPKTLFPLFEERFEM
jgi:BAI1-associated protein 3